ncbi:MAG: dsDNA nuclease domain-containing protein [Sulfuricaulis sp.]
MSSLALQSVRDAMPTNQGGIYARQGFAYQDDVAAKFYIEMLSNENLVEVACETHDDILLIWNQDSIEIAEYAQVKAEHPDRLWSIAMLCEKTKSRTKPDGYGTSILETSLARDSHLQHSWFRIVTCRQIHSDLDPLIQEHGHSYRLPSHPPFSALTEQINQKIGNFKSIKGNDALYWLTNTCWQVISETDISSLNHQALAQVLHAMGEPSDPDAVRSIYDNLRTLAKDTAELPLSRYKEKHVTRSQLIEKIKSWNQPYPRMGQVERLEQKLKDAGLDSTCLGVAKDQRRFYLMKKRTSAYLTTDQAEDVEHNVLDVLHKLRSALDSGELVEDGVNFHDRCLKAVSSAASIAMDSNGVVLGGYLSGCMYEITARCRHRFKKVSR